MIFTLDKVGKYYGTKKVLENVNLLFERGSKIAFVGQNGMGKTTLAKILVNEISYDGKVFAEDDRDGGGGGRISLFWVIHSKTFIFIIFIFVIFNFNFI